MVCGDRKFLSDQGSNPVLLAALQSCPLATREAPVLFLFLIWNSGCSGSPLRSQVPSWRRGLLSLQRTCPPRWRLGGERGLWARGLEWGQVRAQSTGSVVGVLGLSCPVACGVFLDERIGPRLLHWQARFFSPEPPGKPLLAFLLRHN